MSIYDDGTDLGENPPLPAAETRGGKDVDWGNARPGEPLPEKTPDPDLIRSIERVTGEKYDPETGKWS